jgi:lipopolysaccharide transport system ATP-binding protein
MKDENLIRVEELSKKFCLDLKKSLWYGIQDIADDIFGRNGTQVDLRPHEFWALKHVSFKLNRGECLGLLGRNGAGKSTLLKLLNGLIKPNAGSIHIRGRVGALIELGAGFNPILTGRENIYINAAVLGLCKKRVNCIIDDIITFSGIEQFVDTPVKNYSSGMRVRLGFAVASRLNPNILLVDEVLAVGDTQFQRKCLQYMLKYLETGGSLVLVSHNMHLIQSICNRCLVLDRGQIKFEGALQDGISKYYNIIQNSPKERTVSKDCFELGETPPVVIEKVAIHPTDHNEIHPGDGVILTLHYNSVKEIPAVTWGFSIWTENQRLRITTCTAKYDGINYNIGKGRGLFHCNLHDFPLVPGRYTLKAGIYDSKTSWPIARLGWDDMPIYFTVTSSGNEVDNRHVADGDIMTMNVDWGT